MHSWHCTQHTNIIVTSQIIKFNNSFRFSGGTLLVLSMIKNQIPISCLKSNSFAIRIVSTTSSIPSPQETGIVKHRGFDICILRNQCHTFILSFFSSSKIFVLSTKQISDKVYNLPTKKTQIFMLNLIFVHKQCMLLVTYMKYGLCCQYFQSLNQF